MTEGGGGCLERPGHKWNRVRGVFLYASRFYRNELSQKQRPKVV